MKIEDIVIADIYLEKKCVKKDIPFVRYRIVDGKCYYLPVSFFKNMIKFMTYKENYKKDDCGRIVNVVDNSIEYFQEKPYNGHILNNRTHDYQPGFQYYVSNIRELRSEINRGNVYCVKDGATRVSFSKIKKIHEVYGHNFEELRDEINENVLYGNK